jgi:hypothetical protein
LTVFANSAVAPECRRTGALQNTAAAAHVHIAGVQIRNNVVKWHKEIYISRASAMSPVRARFLQ